jgi:hypothetical protein
MTRTVSAGIGSVLPAVASQPGYLVRIDLPGPADTPSGPGPQYLCSFDVDFVYSGVTWHSADLAFDGMNWSTTSSQNGRMTLGDPDLIWWQIAAGGPSTPPLLQDAPISVWQAYAEVAEEAVQLWSGRIGQVARSQMTLVCNIRSDSATTLCPRRRVQSISPTIGKYLLPPGKIIMVGNQKWVLPRKLNGGT